VGGVSKREQALIRELVALGWRDTSTPTGPWGSLERALIAPPNSKQPMHHPKCSIDYRGCHPDCAFQAYYDKVDE